MLMKYYASKFVIHVNITIYEKTHFHSKAMIQSNKNSVKKLIEDENFHESFNK